MKALKHTFSDQLPKSLFSYQSAIPVDAPELILFNDGLIEELGVPDLFLDKQMALGILSGNEAWDSEKVIAQAYAGHQFGHFNRLGDGRAVLLGEIASGKGLYDLQLKGSGRTPYSRGGDGRATFYSMLREYLISEAMHALHIPTSRSLSVVRTGNKVYREETHQGGVLARVAASHIRVGTFEFARYMAKKGALEALLTYTIKRHYPDLLDHENHALALLERVMQKQSDLIVHWLRVGFIHGVMNTDNVTISGETIDYGPCAFMNAYHPNTVFSSIDTEGRYAFANQPNIAFWNLKVFANALLPVIDENEEVAKEKAQSVLNLFPEMFSKAYFEMMSNKLGIINREEADQDLIKECLVFLMKKEVDYTNFFTVLREGGALINELRTDQTFEEWYLRWQNARLRHNTVEKSNALMASTNPALIPRNHLVEQALNDAVSGDMTTFNALLNDLHSPYDKVAEMQTVPTDFDEGYQTFCGT